MILLKSLTNPLVWVLILLAAGLVLAKLKRRERLSRIGWWAALVGTILLLVLSLSPVADVLAYSLECRYEPPSEGVLETLDMVVVLGGGSEPSGWLRPQAELSGVAYARVHQGVKIFQRSSAHRLALCGGRLWSRAASEAEVMKAVAIDMGVAEGQILTESKSRNTQENAARLAELLATGQGHRIGLVTSATHMLRAEKVFKQQFPQDTIVPIPVNYLCGPVIPESNTFVPSASDLKDSAVALHEWIGLLWHSLRYR